MSDGETYLENVPEKRRCNREKCLLPARLYSTALFVSDAAIKDISAFGCRIFVPRHVWLPASLQIHAEIFGTPRTAHLVWRSVDMIGVRFTDVAQTRAQ